MCDKQLPVPDMTCFGLTEYFLQCGPDGVVRVKDGRSLEEYINDPRLVARRKGKYAGEMIICSKDQALFGIIPQSA